MTDGRKRIAIIGAGSHARDQHYPALCFIDEIELCAACDLFREKLEGVRKSYDIPETYTDYREMIEKEQPDGVVVVMPTVQLVEVALGCLDMGVHLMIEKPPGRNSTQARQMLDAAAAKDRKVMVSLNRRFIPLIRELKTTALERGLVSCSATYNKDGFVKDRWNRPASLPVADAIHNIDLMRFIAGDVTDIFGFSDRRDANFTNAHCACTRHASGAMGVISTHHCVGARVHHFEIHAMGMSAYLDVGDTHAPACSLWLDGKQAPPPPTVAVDLPANVGLDNYCETLHFARWIAGEVEGESNLADAVESVRLAEAVAGGHQGRMSEFEGSHAR